MSTFKIRNFLPNEQDDKHCLQSCYRMIVEYFSGETISVDEADIATGFRPEEATWPYDAMLSFSGRGFKVKNVETMDQIRFANDPAAEMIDCFNEEIWEQIQKTSDVPRAQSSALKCLEDPNITLVKGIPTLEDLKNETDAGHLIICNVNSKILNGKDGYTGHFVVVEQIDDDFVYLQNPGLPAQANLKLAKEVFLTAWYYPTEKAGNMMVITP